MNIETFREYCLQKPGVTEEFPFDGITLVFKVGGKMFALADIDQFESINLKCEPLRSVELRDRYPAITPGYHMNKKHWNTVSMSGQLPHSLLLELIDHSYDLVFAGLSNASRQQIKSSG